MKKKEFLTTVANVCGIPVGDVEHVLLTAGEVAADVMGELPEGQSVAVPGFGKFEVDVMAAAFQDQITRPGLKTTRIPYFEPSRKFRKTVAGQ